MAPSLNFNTSVSSAASPRNSPRRQITFNTGMSSHSRNSSVGSNFFRSGLPSPAARNERETSMDGSWMGIEHEMGRGDEDQTEEDEGTHFVQETDTFAQFLQESNIIHAEEDHEEPAAAGMALIAKFQKYAEEQAQQAAEIREHLLEVGDSEEGRADDFLGEQTYWDVEHQTWDLFGRMVAAKLQSTDMVSEAPNTYESDLRVREQLLAEDTLFETCNVILEWLRKYAQPPTEDDLEGLPDGWKYTKLAIKSTKRKVRNATSNFKNSISNKTNGRPVQELDPDAPTRDGASLEEEDMAGEQKLMQVLFTFLRKGDIKGAQKLCEDSGQWWRASSLGGAEEAWDPKIDGEPSVDDDDSMVDVDLVSSRAHGTRRRELWKRMCYALARRKDINKYERAVYGLLSGDVDSVTPVCDTWEDYLYVHLNSLAEGIYTNRLEQLGRIPPGDTRFATFDAVTFHKSGAPDSDDPIIMLKRIIDSISAIGDLTDNKFPLRRVQGALVSSRFDELVGWLGDQVALYQEDSEYAPDEAELESYGGLDISDNRLLRVMVHFILVLQSMNAGFEENSPQYAKAENIIVGYIQFLGSELRHDLIPLYAAKLSPQRAVGAVSQMLISAFDKPIDREDIIKKMEEHSLDVDEILRATMDNTLEWTADAYNDVVDGKGLLDMGGMGEVDHNDLGHISALRWLVSGGETLARDTVHQACEVYKRFLLTGRLEAARELWQQIPSSDVLPPQQENGYLDEEQSHPPQFDDEETQVAAAIFIQLESLVIAIEQLQVWRDELKNSPRQNGFYQKDQLKTRFDAAHGALEDTLEIFLADEQMLQVPGVPELRKMYIPEIVFALHNLYIDAGKVLHKKWYSKALELACSVADPEKSLQGPFIESGRLQEYVQELARVSSLTVGAAAEAAKQMPELEIWNIEKKTTKKKAAAAA